MSFVKTQQNRIPSASTNNVGWQARETLLHCAPVGTDACLFWRQ